MSSCVYNWSVKSSGILQIVIYILRPSFTDLFVRHAEIPENHAIYTPLDHKRTNIFTYDSFTHTKPHTHILTLFAVTHILEKIKHKHIYINK